MISQPPFARLLLATEHTDFDTGAERVGLALAGALGLSLSVIVPVASNSESEEADPAYADRTDHAIATANTRLRDTVHAAGVECAIEVRRGDDPAIEIAAEARARNADLVVIRRRGRRGFLARLLIGETVRTVVTRADCSALLVPRACVMWNRRILAVVDASPASEGVALAAIALAVASHLPLTVASTASASSVEAGALAAATTTARTQGVDVEHSVVGVPLADGIATLVAITGADLVVIARDDPQPAAHPHPFGALARAVVGLVQCPVLLFHPHPRR